MTLQERFQLKRGFPEFRAEMNRLIGIHEKWVESCIKARLAGLPEPAWPQELEGIDPDDMLAISA